MIWNCREYRNRQGGGIVQWTGPCPPKGTRFRDSGGRELICDGEIFFAGGLLLCRDDTGYQAGYWPSDLTPIDEPAQAGEQIQAQPHPNSARLPSRLLDAQDDSGLPPLGVRL